jgi:hypothetical protein
MCVGSTRTRAEAEAKVVELRAREIHGQNWAAQYHDRGFEIREHVVTTDFEIPSRPKPRDRFAVKATRRERVGEWRRTFVEVFERREGELARICEYDRNYGMLETFEPFRQGNRLLALISRDYTTTGVLDLVSGEIVAEETASGSGFCPVGFYVPDWWDVHDGWTFPGSEYWDEDKEWPTGDFGFVWGCVWGDDSSWKVQYLDLRRVQEGVIARDDRFGYVRLASPPRASPCLDATSPVIAPSSPPDFVVVSKYEGVASVRFAVEVDFDLASGRVSDEYIGELSPLVKDGATK